MSLLTDVIKAITLTFVLLQGESLISLTEEKLMSKDTRIDLVQELRKFERSVTGVKELIQKAEAGEFHDFKSELSAPKVALSYQLRRVGLTKLAQDVEYGIYDELPDKSDLENAGKTISKLFEGERKK